MDKIIQITAGRGPAECAWAAAQVLKKILEEAEQLGVEAKVLQHIAGPENGTVELALLRIAGNNTDAFVKSWTGTIQWIGQSNFRKMHKRKNWFIGVFEMDNLQPKGFSEKDIQYQAMRSSGAGGQHVNKVSSAIRAIHIPTGISTVAMDSRSQHQNKKLATERLMGKLKEQEVQQLKNHVTNQWENQLQVQRGNPTRTFTGSDFKKQPAPKKYKSERQQLKRIDFGYEE